MRIVDDPAGVLDGTFAALWLRVRKRPGKICREGGSFDSAGNRSANGDHAISLKISVI
jgi:hypothetical protein